MKPAAQPNRPAGHSPHWNARIAGASPNDTTSASESSSTPNADEELVIILSGCPSLRTPEGTRELDEGEAIHFPLGEEGAHQILNHGEEMVTFLAISSSGRPDLVVYPDSEKIGVGERLPTGGGLRGFFRKADRVDYWSGEAPPEDPASGR